MRIRLGLKVPDGGITLPVNYNRHIQSYIYSTLSGALASFLHDLGFRHGKRSFKLFTFSRILGRVRVSNGHLTLRPPMAFLMISSPLREFIRDLANGIMERKELVITDRRLPISWVEFVEEPPLDPPLTIRTLAPITVYSTLMTADGNKKTYYYSPYEREFSALIRENALKKHYVLTGRHTDGDLTLEPLRVRESLLTFKGTVIRGWSGTFVLKGSRSLIRVVYDAGLGSKNSQGFGMFEVVRDDRVR